MGINDIENGDCWTECKFYSWRELIEKANCSSEDYVYYMSEGWEFLLEVSENMVYKRRIAQ